MNKDKSEKKIMKYIVNCDKKYVDKNFRIHKYLKFDELNDIIELFNNTFELKIGKERKKFFNTHIKHLKIEKVPEKCTINKRQTSGTYLPLENKITLYGNLDDNYEVSERLMHELLHMSSNKANGLVDGLSISTIRNKKYGTTGNGINEGYTELINSRYFAMQEYYSGYRQEMILAAGIEKIVGKELMLDAYFKSSLLDVLIELNNYVDEKQRSLDLINKIDKLNRESDFEKREILFKEAKNEIVTIKRKKILQDLATNKINIVGFTTSNLFDIELYDKYNFIYDDYANVVDSGDRYMVMGNSGFLYLNKDDENVKAYMILKK